MRGVRFRFRQERALQNRIVTSAASGLGSPPVREQALVARELALVVPGHALAERGLAPALRDHS